LKKLITAVILVGLILASFSMLLGPKVRADTSEVNVVSYSWYAAPSNTVLAGTIGDLVAVGEIQNVGSNVIGTVSVVGLAYYDNSTDSTQTLLDQAQAFIPINDLPAGQKAPFYIDFLPANSITNDTSWVSSVTNVTVVVNYAADTTVVPYSGLTIPSSTYDNSSGTFTVTGTVKNTGDQTAAYIWVDTTFYNASGTVVALNYTNYLTDSFAPGQSLPFTATPTDNTVQLSSEITNYSSTIQYTSLTASPTPTPSPSPTATPTSTPTASPPPTQSPVFTLSGLTYIAVGAIVIVVVAIAVAVLLLLRKRHENAQSDLPPPP
jgi:hypothetical protein